MYKRRVKTGSLGIVRSTANQQKSFSGSLNKSDKDDPMSKESANLDGKISEENSDPDEVLSDSEPSPKRSRRSGISFVSKENSTSSPSPQRSTSNQLGISSEKKIISQRLSSKQSQLNLNISPLKSQKSSYKQAKQKEITPSKLARKNKPTNPKSFLEDLFMQAGLSLSDGKSSNILSADQAIFVRDISILISNKKDEQKKNVEHIMKDLNDYCENEKCFKMALTCTETASECDVSRGATQDSLMRLLLHISCLQAQVTQLLLDKLAKIVMDGPSDNGETPVIAWVRMILQCFRFLDRTPTADQLNERLLDIILATSDVTVQQEVIISLPDIINDNEHHHTALELSKLIRRSPQLLASALEALTNLSLQPDVRAEVQPVLMKAIHKVQPEFLPAILKFLLTDCDAPLMDEIITFLRLELDLSETEGDTASIQVLVYSTLRDALLASRTLPNAWLKNISTAKTQIDHKPIDIIMLLILLSTTNDPVRQKSIEAVFRNKIRSDVFTETLINETMKVYIAVIKEHFQVTTKLAGTLLKSPDPNIVDFASKMYIGMFVNMDGLWCKWVVSDLQVCVGAGDSNVARAALNILQHLTDNYHDRVKPLGIILMLLLNKLNDLALSEVRQLMDVLCHITYSDINSPQSEHSALQDEINILVQKQLASSRLSVLRSGVVGCIMTIKHMTSIPADSSEPTNLNEPPENIKRAIHLLELLLSSTRNCTEAHGLALDQLSHLLLSGINLHPAFIQKLSGLMRDTLQDAFLISPSDFVSKDDVIKSSLQYHLDDEEEGAIALNLCDLVAVEADPSKGRPMMPISCVHPLLRLLRGLEIGDLSEIDALLGCGINMPEPAVFSEFSQLSSYQQHLALHCLFHCINWFSEVINCFSFLVKNNEPEKVLVRLRTLVYLRSVLARCLPLAMEYVPPLCHFQALPKPKLNSSEKPVKKGNKKKGKKKGKKKQDDEASLTGNDNSSQLEEEEEQQVESEADLVKYKHYFRELDIDVWLILTQPLTFAPTPEKNGVFTPELGPNELLFILDDYVAKLSRALNSSNKRISALKTTVNQNIGFENLDKFSSLHIAKNTIKLLSYICGFLEKTMEYTQRLLKVNDGILDSTGMFIDGSAEIKQCQGKLLKLLAILFSWVGFQNQANNSYLIASLQKLAVRVNSEQAKTKSKKLLVRECVQYFSQCHEHVLDLTSACSLVDVIKALVHHTDDDPNISNSIATICEALLKRRWYNLKGNWEKGAVLNSHMSELVNSYLLHSQDQLTVVTNTLAWLAAEAQQLNEKDSTLSMFPSFSKLNLHILIGGLLKGLEGAVRKKLEDDLSDKEQLDVWSSMTHNMETLVTVVKAYDSKPNLRAFMKGCTAVFRLFLSQGMSTCTFMFKHEPAIVSQILKKLQVTTRYVQTICNFVKVSKDTGLTQFLPAIRSALETILLRVKSIIVINNCSDAFFMGSMKNRDHKGQEIPSQIIQEGEEEETIQNNSDSEPDREDDDNTLNDENEDLSETGSITC